MYIVPIAWLYVALMMSVAEATNSNGTLLGAIVTFVLYGLLPIGLLVYIMGTPGRKRALRARQAQEQAEWDAAAALKAQAATADGLDAVLADTPDASGQAATDTVTPVRKEP